MRGNGPKSFRISQACLAMMKTALLPRWRIWVSLLPRICSNSLKKISPQMLRNSTLAAENFGGDDGIRTHEITDLQSVALNHLATSPHEERRLNMMFKTTAQIKG